MEESKFRRAAPDSPTRCKGNTQGGAGQCPFEAEQDSQFCVRHKGSERTQETARVSMYNLDQWNARVASLRGHDDIKTLRDEIGISRMLLERIIVAAKNDHDLIMESTKIADLVIRIEKLVVSCNRLEATNSALLDKTAVLHLSSVITTIISKYVEPDILELISDEIISSILSQKVEPKHG